MILKEGKKKIVYHYSCLDILHMGHIIMIKKCKEIAGPDGLLIVGILTDSAIMEKKPPPVLNFDERIEIANSIKYIDMVVPQKKYLPFENVKKIKPNILMESESHDKNDIIKAKQLMFSLNGEVQIIPYYNKQSSSKIKNEIIKRGLI